MLPENPVSVCFPSLLLLYFSFAAVFFAPFASHTLRIKEKEREAFS